MSDTDTFLELPCVPLSSGVKDLSLTGKICNRRGHETAAKILATSIGNRIFRHGDRRLFVIESCWIR